MTIQLIRETHPVARKDYQCEACYALRQSMRFPEDFTDEEVVILQRLKDNDWMIKKG